MNILESAADTIADVDIVKAIKTIEEDLEKAIALSHLPKEWGEKRLEVGRIMRLQHLQLGLIRARAKEIAQEIAL